MTPLVFSDSQIQAIADRAKASLPAQVNGRIEKAVRLVRSASVELHADGSATVLSETDGLTGYLVQHGRCTCPDFQFQPAEVQGWCCHRLARAFVVQCQRQAHNAPRMPQETSSAAQASTPHPPPTTMTPPGTYEHPPSTISGQSAPCPLVLRTPWPLRRTGEHTSPSRRLESRTHPRRA
jgi:hypothetical protein